ncbi:MAG TPA: hypothetical protein VFB58_02425 [Chloroflexota bacterium]|nr:hypothetical protein [Chloroflexota bacterium]
MIIGRMLAAAAVAVVSSTPHHLPSRPGAAAYKFSTAGPVMMVTSVTIAVDGVVRVSHRGFCTPVNPDQSIPHRALVRVMHLADRVGFFSLPSYIRGQQTVDTVGPSATVYTTAGAKTVAVGVGASNRAFSAVYDALRHLVPLTHRCGG